jgi:5-methylcytosine-specific restriction endonuclease McrA
VKDSSRQRRISLQRRKEKGPNGRGLCTWCGQEVPKGRISWCGNECVEKYRIRNDAGYARLKVKERDHGICAGCGRDARRIGRIMSKLRQRAGYHWQHEITKPQFGVLFTRLCCTDQAPFRAWRKYRDHDWEADHIVPVVEGGADLGLENLRTLCLACHQIETARLAARRAEARRANGQEVLL